MRHAGQDVRKAARALIASKVRSSAGENPGKQTGKLYRSLGYKVSRSGFMAVIEHKKIAGMKDFYWAYLYYGVRRGAKRRKDHKKQQANGSGWRIAPRNNYIVDALDARRTTVQRTIADSVKRALKPKLR
ncbi:hypothetical protein HZU75_04205 [Chitinibacter fontanus]|uniref:HK97 gp10 family phage protein n=2 Tax=Chitinibacter fontanus TaxID=1737446 RepID=A0A7D5VC94_9NEIS|nr:hypothetical protein HZU75_04205 [Chitinibacter fontanus]